eukprot:3625031-Rhodomonas_salina.2
MSRRYVGDVSGATAEVCWQCSGCKWRCCVLMQTPKASVRWHCGVTMEAPRASVSMCLALGPAGRSDTLISTWPHKFIPNRPMPRGRPTGQRVTDSGWEGRMERGTDSAAASGPGGIGSK